MKKYYWLFPIFGIIFYFIAIFTPAAYFKNYQYDHVLIYWICGFMYERLGSVEQYTFFTDPLKIITSIITSITIMICIGFLSYTTFKNEKDIEQVKFKKLHLLIPAIVIFFSTITWMILMEIAQMQIYGIRLWDRFIPQFGVIGMFLGTCIIIIFTLIINRK